MNEFSAKKLGEVLAFAEVGLDTIDRGRTALETVFSDLAALEKSNADHKDGMMSLLEDETMAKITTDKAASTGEKLKKMRDMYIGDEWDNPAELMEWLGFFEGAALVHWSLVSGASEKLNNDKLADLASQAIAFHRDILETVNSAIAKVGKERS